MAYGFSITTGNAVNSGLNERGNESGSVNPLTNPMSKISIPSGHKTQKISIVQSQFFI